MAQMIAPSFRGAAIAEYVASCMPLSRASPSAGVIAANRPNSLRPYHDLERR